VRWLRPRITVPVLVLGVLAAVCGWLFVGYNLAMAEFQTEGCVSATGKIDPACARKGKLPPDWQFYLAAGFCLGGVGLAVVGAGGLVVGLVRSTKAATDSQTHPPVA
jgi:hypothetical protein